MADDPLRADIEAVRQGIIAQGVLCLMDYDPFWTDMLAVMGPLPGVKIIRTVLEEGDSTPIVDPEMALRRRPDAPLIGETADEQRTTEPLPEPDPQILARVMTMSKRRKLKAYVTENWVSLTDAAGEECYSGSVAEVYEALKQDTIAQLPPDPAQLLRERLSRCVGWNWTLEHNGPDHYSLARNGERLFTGPLEQMEIIAASRILNVVPNGGYPE